jgi:hypothetical protein
MISVFKPQNAASLLASPGTAIWTPATGNRIRLIRVLFTSSVTGNLVLTDGSGGAVIGVIPVVTGEPAVPFDFGGLGYRSTAIGNAIFAFNSAGAATLSGELEGGEQAY